MTNTKKIIIETWNAASCPICGSPGHTRYQNLIDGFSITTNEWSIKKCLNQSCLHGWPDPQPTPDSIAAAYRSYPLHSIESKPPAQRPSVIGRFYKNLLGILKIEKRRTSLESFGLPHGEGKTLLELGCGNGARLVALKTRGFRVEGQDIMPSAFDSAQKRGIQIHKGELVDLALPKETFDYIVMNHVLEHVSDPQGLLVECGRLLKPGGKLISIQPNGASLAHFLFRGDWVGLDPPRHLHIFTPKSILSATRPASFGQVQISTTYLRNEGCTLESWRRRSLRTGRHTTPPYALMALGQLFALLLSPLARRRGDEIILTCVK